MRSNLLLFEIIIFLLVIPVSFCLNPQWITDITINPSNPSIGETVTFTATMHMAGGGTMSYLRVYGYIDGHQIGMHEYPSVSAGEVTNVSFTWVADPGSHTIRMHILIKYDEYDSVNTIESNDREAVFSVSGTPGPANLIIENVELPMNMTDGKKVSLPCTVKNIGNAWAKNIYVMNYIDNTIIDGKSYTDLGPGEERTRYYDLITKCGALFSFKVDPQNYVSESNDFDNTWSKKIECRPANLIISHVSYKPNYFHANDKVKFTWLIRNVGNTNSRAGKVRVIETGTMKALRQIDYPELKPNGLYSMTYTWNVNCSKIFKIIADYGNSTEETHENDNTWILDKKCSPFSSKRMVIK